MFPNESIGVNVLESKNKNTIVKKFKFEELPVYDISCKKDDQNFEYIHKNTLIHIINEMAVYEATNEYPEIKRNLSVV